MLKREFIPFGRENAISRSDLSRITGLSDRKTRSCIAKLRAQDDGTNIVIVSTSRGRGYYRTDNPEEIDGFIRDMLSRVTQTLNAIKVAQMALARLKNKRMYGEGLGG